MEVKEPLISIIIPCFNEEKYIGNVIAFLKSQKYTKEKIEVFIVDGGSIDNTVKIVEDLKESDGGLSIDILNNLNKTVPFAMNLGLQNCSGDFIVRLDAHTKYSGDYLIKIIETFKQTNADIVGGPMRAIGENSFQDAVAYCTSTKFGVGNSSFHTENAAGYVDSVYLGAWKKEIFDDVGVFDTQMKRNQDDEFHYRAKSKGKKIYLNPEIKSWYFPRADLKSLCKQYFQYGQYKPLVLKKVSSEIKLRHIVPSMFTLYIGLIPFLYNYFHFFAFLFLFLYFVMTVLFSLNNNNIIKVKLYSLIIYPALHFSYGTGFISGIPKLFGINKN